MLERTKAPTTDGFVELKCRLPAEEVEKAKAYLDSLGAEDVEEAVHWREAFPDFGPHIALRGARKREGLTQDQLAQKLGEGVTQSNVSEMESGKRPIGKAMAKRLATILHADYRVFL